MTDRDETPDRAADGAHELDAAEAARLRAALQRLPAAVEPERDLWPSIRARIDQGRVQALPAAPSTRTPLPWYASPRRLAVAAVLLVMVSVAGTRVLLRAPASTVAAGAPANAQGAIPSGVIPTPRGPSSPSPNKAIEDATVAAVPAFTSTKKMSLPLAAPGLDAATVSAREVPGTKAMASAPGASSTRPR